MICNIFLSKLLPFSRSYSNKLDSPEKKRHKKCSMLNEWCIMKIYEKLKSFFYFYLLRCLEKQEMKKIFPSLPSLNMRNCIKLSIFHCHRFHLNRHSHSLSSALCLKPCTMFFMLTKHMASVYWILFCRQTCLPMIGECAKILYSYLKVT